MDMVLYATKISLINTLIGFTLGLCVLWIFKNIGKGKGPCAKSALNLIGYSGLVLGLSTARYISQGYDEWLVRFLFTFVGFGAIAGLLGLLYGYYKKKKAEKLSRKEPDEAHWEAAAAEFLTSRHEGVWAKVFAETGGNEAKAKANYLKIRANALATTLPDVSKEDTNNSAAATSTEGLGLIVYALIVIAFFAHTYKTSHLEKLRTDEAQETMTQATPDYATKSKHYVSVYFANTSSGPAPIGWAISALSQEDANKSALYICKQSASKSQKCRSWIHGEADCLWVAGDSKGHLSGTKGASIYPLEETKDQVMKDCKSQKGKDCNVIVAECAGK